MDTQATNTHTEDAQGSEHAGTKKVEIFSTSSCHFCHMAKEWLAEKGIPYEDYNVGENAERRKEMVEITGQLGVPVIRVGEDVMVGFNQEQLAKILEVAE
jgi:glutaredoxin-like YruB-family protein